MSKNIGKFCSVAKPGTMIFPKKINGYQEPEPQILTSNKQKMKFVYTPIKYKINYKLSKGKFNQEQPKEYYTIEDETYTPPTPSRDGYTFVGWNPANIPNGSFGEMTFKAEWKENAVLLPGPELNAAINNFVGGENVISICISNTVPNGDFINISASSTPIFAYFNDGVLLLYSGDNDIFCNMHMDHAFENFTLLRDIKCFSKFKCKEGTDISYIFSGCKLLSNVSPINKWASGKFSNFTGALNGTSALETGRVPVWFRWPITINYISTSGVVIDKTTSNRIPGETIFYKSFDGYVAKTKSIIVESKDIEYTFIYEPIVYNIDYDLHGGKLYNPKTTYTIEDETYYPAEPVITDKIFYSWSPVCIEHGEFGSMTFVANYKKK